MVKLTMPRNIYRHTITDVVTELDDKFAALFPGAFELVEEKKTAAKPAPAKKAVEPAPAASTETDSSKEGNK